MSQLRGEQIADKTVKPKKLKPGTAYQVARTNAGATEAEWGAVNLASGNAVTGALPLANGGTGAALVDPNADRILFWDDSAGQMTWLAPGTGLTITGTTIDVTGATITVQEGDATVDAAVTTLDFGPGFDVSSSPAGEANIALDLTETGRADSGAVYATQIQDSSGNEVLKFAAAGSAVNEMTISSAATGSPVQFLASGDDTNIGITFKAKGTGEVLLRADTVRVQDLSLGAATVLSVGGVATGVNYLSIANSATTNALPITATGTDADIDINLVPKGTGKLKSGGSAVYVAGGTDVALADGGTGTSLADPGADRIMFWDDSAGFVDWLSVSGASIAGTTLTVTTQTNALLDGSSHTDTAAGAVTRGDLIVGNSTPKWSRLAIGAAKTWVKSDGTDVSWAATPVYAGELFRPATATEAATASATNPATVSTTLTNLGTSYLYVGGMQMVTLDDFATIRLLARAGNTGGQSGTISIEIRMDGTTSLVTGTTTNVGLTAVTATAAISQTGTHYISARIKSSVATDDPLLAFVGFELY